MLIDGLDSLARCDNRAYDSDLSANQQRQGRAHHDALEFPDGRIALLTKLYEGQQATVLQLPAEPNTAVEAQSQRRVAYIA